MTTNAIEFKGEIRQIRTMVDGSINCIINMPEECIDQAKVLLGWHHLMVRGVMELEGKADKKVWDV